MAKKDGGGIQQAAGLIRYFDEESEDAWKITPTQIYLAKSNSNASPLFTRCLLQFCPPTPKDDNQKASRRKGGHPDRRRRARDAGATASQHKFHFMGV